MTPPSPSGPGGGDSPAELRDDTVWRENVLQGSAVQCQALSIFDMLPWSRQKQGGTMNVSLTPELEKFVESKVESGLYNNASEVVRESLRLLKEHDEIRVKWREQIERGWLQAQRGELVDGAEAFRKADDRIKKAGRKRA